MKAAGGEAIFVAMSAVVNARQRLVAKHGFDLMLAAAWITEDTVRSRHLKTCSPGSAHKEHGHWALGNKGQAL